MLTNATWLFVMVNFSDGNVLVSDKLTDESQSFGWAEYHLSIDYKEISLDL